MTIQLTYTGAQNLFSVDFKFNEDRPVRIDLYKGVLTTLTGFGYGELAGLPQWESLLALADITLTLGGTDAPLAEFSTTFVTGATPRDVTIFNASVPFAADIVGVRLSLSTSAAATHTLRTLAGGLGSPLSLGMLGTGAPEDLGGLLSPLATVAKNSSIFLRTSLGTTAGTLFLTLRRTGK